MMEIFSYMFISNSFRHHQHTKDDRIRSRAEPRLFKDRKSNLKIRIFNTGTHLNFLNDFPGIFSISQNKGHTKSKISLYKINVLEVHCLFLMKSMIFTQFIDFFSKWTFLHFEVPGHVILKCFGLVFLLFLIASMTEPKR